LSESRDSREPEEHHGLLAEDLDGAVENGAEVHGAQGIVHAGSPVGLALAECSAFPSRDVIPFGKAYCSFKGFCTVLLWRQSNVPTGLKAFIEL
jgi:hypothetical protein